ncbi:MAG: hypothetical protein EWV49_12480 [Microcystis aeruginosa Ma_QC_Ch_20071001_S25]|uniref:Uncharacterized protein n=1 Tax=Microcystis aeruginosa Ma_QC_Ch_20071001_S25D TaxID=2486250 RepID=A0A552FHU2_MICAE|nr:MAG: hypothetical protein EWV57_18945 [Microcystis aeruginosa Ma_QC_Ch_20071001_S25D]TRU48846.1 MAG: hypothetical protein EWV49_12480 [Microcystis aeruginosa Ma_QC_Ch_20071001_S25]TRU59553.1 MAG: hypothetical protein EWV90_16840 [Microcystis aeruginosa Ma_QC_Ch_20071001_M135]
MLQEKVWVLGTRTDAGVGKVRLAIFRGRKRIPLKQEALNDLEISSPNYCLSVVPSLPTIIDEFRREDREFDQRGD